MSNETRQEKLQDELIDILVDMTEEKDNLAVECIVYSATKRGKLEELIAYLRHTRRFSKIDIWELLIPGTKALRNSLKHSDELENG